MAQYHSHLGITRLRYYFVQNINKTIDMEENNIEVLNAQINEILDDVRLMARDFSTKETFSHYSTLLGVLTPGGLLGGIRENAERKKLFKFLDTKIYRDMSFDEIGFKLIEIAEDVCDKQIQFQKLTSQSDPRYFDNVKSIIDTLEKCRKRWGEIAPNVLMEELKLKNGSTIQLGPQVEFEMQSEYIKMDLPDDYKKYHKKVKQLQKGPTCSVILFIFIAATVLAACSLL